MNSGVVLIVLAALTHAGLIYAHRRSRPSAGLEGRAVALLWRLATVAGFLGWSTLGLGLVLDVLGIHTLSAVLAVGVIVFIPLALICLSMSIVLHAIIRTGDLRPAATAVHTRLRLYVKAVPALLGTVTVAIGGLAMLLLRPAAKRLLQGISEPPEQDENSKLLPEVHLHFNYRTGQCDDGSDAAGSYRKKPYFPL